MNIVVEFQIHENKIDELKGLQSFCQLFYSHFVNFGVRGHTRHLSMVDDSHIVHLSTELKLYGTFVNDPKSCTV